MERERNRFWTGFFIGAALGAGAGLLMAPMPGNEARARIKDFSSQIGSRASTVPSGVQEKVHGVSSKSRSYLQELRDRMSVAVQAGVEAAHERREELKTEVQAVTEPKPSM